MPTRPISILIIVCWLVSTGYLLWNERHYLSVSREATFDEYLADRVIEEPISWNVFLNDIQVGSSISNVQPQPDASFILTNNLKLDGNILVGQLFKGASGRISCQSTIHVSNQGRLESLEAYLNVEATKQRIDVRGKVEGKQLQLTTSGLGATPETFSIPFNASSFASDTLSPTDRLRGLRVGKQWRTVTLNPLAGHSVGTMLGPAKFEMSHRVARIESVEWNRNKVECFLVESTSDRGVARTWVRRSDGRVLRTRIPVQAGFISLEIMLEMSVLNSES